MGACVSGEADWSRRSFLSARGLGAAAGGALGALVGDGLVGQSGREAMRLEVCFARRAMACEFNVFLPALASANMPAAEAALDEIQLMESLLTVYSADSLMSYINQNAFNGPVRTDGRVLRLLKRADELTKMTDGAFDIASGALLKAWGFFRGPRRVPSESELAEAMARSGMRHVELNSEHQTVRFRVQGVEINLGAIGKGYAIDRAIELLRSEHGMQSVLIQGGLSSTRAIGSASEEEAGWLVGIQDPADTSRWIATVRLRDRALGTSAANRQYFEVDGRQYGHILDPRTGWPGGELAGVSVLAPDAATADALSTAFFVMGLDRARDFCHNHPEIAALLVLRPGKSGRSSASPRVVTFNLTKKDYQLAGKQ